MLTIEPSCYFRLNYEAWLIRYFASPALRPIVCTELLQFILVLIGDGKQNPNNNKIPHDFPIATMDEVCEDEKKNQLGT